MLKVNTGPGPHELRYQALLARYLNATQYDAIKDLAGPGVARNYSQARPLRSAAHRVAEFYAAKLWGGSLGEAFELDLDNLEANGEILNEKVEEIFEWSNWAQEKQAAARKFAIMGDMLLHAAENEPRTRVYIEVIDPRDFTEFRKDERGNLTYLRLDIPKLDPENPAADDHGRYIRTEVWEEGDRDELGEKAPGTLTVWEHDKGKNEDLGDLGAPLDTFILGEGETGDHLGIDFIPFVHAKFKDVGSERGQGAYEHTLQKQDEADLICEKLHKLAFPKYPWVAEQNTTDPEGRPTPATFAYRDPDNPPEATEFDVGGEKVVTMPAGYTLNPRIPPIDFAAHTEILEKMLIELEKDLPELRYHRLNEQGGEQSGRAIKYQLADLIDKVDEARGNGLASVSKVLKMCFTIAQNAGLEGFESLGVFEDGDFELTFTEREVFPLTEAEEAETQRLQIQNVQSLLTMGLIDLTEARRRLGIDDEAISGAELVPGVEIDQGTSTTENILRQLGVGSERGDTNNGTNEAIP